MFLLSLMRILGYIFTGFWISFYCSAQIVDDQPIDEKDVSPWRTENAEEYEGIYFFGISEGESHVFLSIENETVCLQVLNHKWEQSDKDNIRWRPIYTNYTNVSIQGNRFYSNESDGEFVWYTHGSKKEKGLKLYNPPLLYEDEYEIGLQGDKPYVTYLQGKYPMTKFNLITDDEINRLPLTELKIMSNEIYARYGFQFKAGGEMDLYFSQQDWYINEGKTDVEGCMTAIEKENIRRIAEAEKKKSN